MKTVRRWYDLRHLQELGLHQGELVDQVAVVTGAGQGIGKELARALSWMGAKVILAEIDNESGDATARQIEGNKIGRAHV